MSSDQTSVLLQDLLHREPLDVQRWLAGVESGQVDVPSGFHWPGLASAAVQMAQATQDSQSGERALAWARIAKSVDDRLARNSNDPEPFVMQAMMLCAAMIRRYGASPGDTIRDPQPIIDWFIQQLPFSQSEAEARASRRLELDIEEIKELRRIKNRLSVIQVLAECRDVHMGQDVLGWLAIRGKLP